MATTVGAPAAGGGMSQGGATIRSPTRTARRPACERAAQPSSATSIGVARAPSGPSTLSMAWRAASRDAVEKK